jgi:hypothetical protein
LKNHIFLRPFPLSHQPHQKSPSTFLTPPPHQSNKTPQNKTSNSFNDIFSSQTRQKLIKESSIAFAFSEEGKLSKLNVLLKWQNSN